VSADAGALITAVNGGESITASVGDTGEVTLTLTVSGTWTVTGELNGKEQSVQVVVDSGYEVAFNLNPRLPEGYKELEYIQSNGLQYIDTGVQPKATLKFAMDFAVDRLTSSAVSFFGWRKKAGTKYVQFRGFEYNTNIFRIIYGGSSSINATAIDSPLSVGRHALELDCQNKTLVWDGTSSSFALNGTPAFSTTDNIALFASNNEGTVGEYSSMKLYKAQIWDTGSLIRDFVPCTDPSGKAGLYDLVNQAFYTNKRVSAFIAGPEV